MFGATLTKHRLTYSSMYRHPFNINLLKVEVHVCGLLWYVLRMSRRNFFENVGGVAERSLLQVVCIHDKRESLRPFTASKHPPQPTHMYTNNKLVPPLLYTRWRNHWINSTYIILRSLWRWFKTNYFDCIVTTCLCITSLTDEIITEIMSWCKCNNIAWIQRLIGVFHQDDRHRNSTRPTAERKLCANPTE